MYVVTFVILGILFLVYLSALNLKDTGVEFFDYYLRVGYHVNMSHLLANAVSFIILSPMEEILGWQKFLFAIIFIWLISTLILYTIHVVIPSRKIPTVGFSGVIFGLMVIYLSLLNKDQMLSIVALVASIIPQIFVKGISFEGHLSGIIAGFIFVKFFL